MCHDNPTLVSPTGLWQWSDGYLHKAAEDGIMAPGDSSPSSPNHVPRSGAVSARRAAVSVAAGRAAAARTTDALDQDSVGWRILRKQGWTEGAGLGAKGTGLPRPITDHLKAGETLYAREEGAGVALLAELHRLETTPVTDWKKGSTTDCTRWEDLTAFFLRGGTLDDHQKVAVATKPEPAQAFSEHRDSWSDEIVLTLKGTGKEVRVRCEADAEALKRTWAKAQERDLALDRASLSPDHFFACCIVPASVQLLCVETTGEVSESTIEVAPESGAAGRALKLALERRLRGPARVLCVRRVFVAQDGGESADSGDGVGADEDGSLPDRHCVSPAGERRPRALAAEAVPQAHEEGLELGDNAADIAADNMAATFAAKTAYEEMQREVVPPEGADRGSTLQPASGWAGSVEKHLERTHWSTPSELSAQDLAVLGRGFECPAPEGDEESLSVPPSEASVNLGHHACERLSNRSISRKEIWQAKTRGRLFLSIEQKRGVGDPELTTYQLNCKREALKEWGRILAQRFPNIVAAEPVEKGGGMNKRLEMRLDGSDGLGGEVKRLLKARGFLGPHIRCHRCGKHVTRIKYEDAACRTENDALVVVEGFVGKPRLAGGVVTTYIRTPQQKHTARGAEAKQRLSIYAVTSKTKGACPRDSELNAEASRLLGCTIFGRVYLVCRRDLKMVCDYPLENFRRDFHPNPSSATLGADLLEERTLRHEADKPLVEEGGADGEAEDRSAGKEGEAVVVVEDEDDDDDDEDEDGKEEERFMSCFARFQTDLDRLPASIPTPSCASDSDDDSELGWGTSDSEEELESANSASQSWMRTPRASLAPSLRTILVNDTPAPTGDQQGLDRTFDVQRRRDQEIERRQREDSQEHGSDGSRWARENWGQRAAGLESLDRIVGVQQQRRHDPEIERQQREDSPERNEPRQWARERRGLDRTLDVQRRRDQEIERRQYEDSQEHGGDATGRRWARKNWGQRAAGLESNVAKASVQERASSATGSRGLFKTKLCRFFSTPNGCQRGDACSFAHGDAQVRPYRRSTASVARARPAVGPQHGGVGVGG